MGTWLSDEKRLAVLAALVDGNSERAVERMTGVARMTISRLAVAFGQGAERLHNRLVRDLSCSFIDMDECWGWCKVKEARVDPKRHDPALVGDQWTWLAMDRSSRLAISWVVGKRTEANAEALIADVRARVITAPQISTDGLALYEQPIAVSFGPGTDYGQMIKHYRTGAQRGPDHRYEPPRDPFITKNVVLGAPNMRECTTFAVERNNGTMRHKIGRMRRLVYAFSKDVEHHRAAVSLCYCHYNLCWIVKTLRCTPAMAAHVVKNIWELGDFMEAILTEPAATKPEPKPLAHPVPTTTSRPLPNGRGFLRLVGSSGSAPAAPPEPAPRPPSGPAVPTAEVPAPAPTAAPSDDRQLDLFAWKPRPASPQLFLFGSDIERPK